MILQWNGTYDQAYFAWYTFCTVALLATLLPGLILLCSAASGRPVTWREVARWLPILCGCVLLWMLLGFSLAFGPGPLPDVETPVMSGNVDLRDLLGADADPDTVVDDIGRGGVIGGFYFAGLRWLGTEGDPDRPRFATRRPGFRLPLATFVGYQTAIFVAVIGAVGVLVKPCLSWPRVTLLLLAWCVVVYAPMAHWVWGDGWLALQGAIDPGGGLLHLTIAVTALAVVIIAGKERTATLESEQVAESAAVPAATDNVDAALVGGSLLVCLAQLVLTTSLSVYVTQVPLLALGALNLLLAGAAGSVVWSLLTWKQSDQLSVRAGALGMLAGCCSLAGGGALLTPQSSMIVGAVAAAVGVASLGRGAVAQSPSAGRVLMAAQGVPAAIGLVIPAILGVSTIGMRRLDASVVTSLVDGDIVQLIHQLTAVGAVGLLVFLGTALLFLACERLGRRVSAAADD